ncbi:TylF/MycF family methyltransferase [Baia soyae]|uniref:O-methyltransferase n=1 Tax=Baia soyae TaxID=1544746 RepID=A0A4R2S009_9BACL|nr:TylF/MycF family methyltransferase [Baia soyae]TCP70695.1 O-methyltransferase [Baia soyae]
MERNNAEDLYLELLKKALLYEIWIEHEKYYHDPSNIMFNPTMETRQYGLDWPPIAHSMIGRERMNNLHQCMESVITDNIEGDFIETGVWRGGACIFMRGFLKSYGITNRKVWVADSFEGLPPPDPDYPADTHSPFHTMDYLRVSLEEVADNFKKYNLLDDNVCFLKGWFKDTLPTAPIEKIAIARLDGDMYSSTWESLANLYPRVSVGGYIIIDDYDVDQCKAAVHYYRDCIGVHDEIKTIDQNGVYWRKTK